MCMCFDNISIGGHLPNGIINTQWMPRPNAYGCVQAFGTLVLFCRIQMTITSCHLTSPLMWVLYFVIHFTLVQGFFSVSIQLEKKLYLVLMGWLVLKSCWCINITIIYSTKRKQKTDIMNIHKQHVCVCVCALDSLNPSILKMMQRSVLPRLLPPYSLHVITNTSPLLSKSQHPYLHLFLVITLPQTKIQGVWVP